MLKPPSEITFILLDAFPTIIPGGPYALIISAVIEGLIGGIATIQGTITAYVSDCTPDGSRAAVFSRLAGTLMVGMSVGSIMSGFIISLYGNL